MLHGSGAVEKRIDEQEGRFADINDNLSGVGNQFIDDKQKFKDETEREFVRHKLVLHEVVEAARKISGIPTSNSWTACRNCEQGDQPSTTSCTSRARTNKGYLHQKNMIPKDFTDKADEWRT